MLDLPSIRLWFQRARNTIWSAALQVALPETCAGCGRTGHWICSMCEPLLVTEPSPGCMRCGRKGTRRPQCGRCSSIFPDSLRQLRAGFAYEGTMRRAIQRFKYNGEYQRGYDLGHRLSQLAPSRFPVQKIDFVMPVPLHPRRYRARGFNQSGILAECIGNSLDLPVVTPVLRIRNTSPQVRLSADERLSNLEEAFRIDGSKSSLVENSVVLLVDDVTTTGATIAAVASTLESGGCREAYGLTLAREQ